jgi:hypothetical protein
MKLGSKSNNDAFGIFNSNITIKEGKGFHE